MPRTLATYSLLTYDEVCRACGVATPGPTTGDVWEGLLDVAERASRKIETYLRRHIVTQGQVTEYHTPEEQHAAELFLGQFPVLAVASVDEGAWSSSGTWTSSLLLTANADFVANGETGVLTRVSGGALSSWPAGIESVRVVYTAGYASTAVVPQELKNFAASLASRMWATSRRGAADAQSVSDGMGSITRFLPAELLTMERQALASERRYHTTGRAA